MNKSNAVRATKKDIDWYNTFYQQVQPDFPSWYKLLLPNLIERLIHNPNHKIVELGCGQSRLLKYLVDNNYVRAGNVFGVDQSDAAIKYSKKKLPQSHIIKSDIYSLSYKDNTFDSVLLMETIEHLENPLAGLAEAKRILKKMEYYIFHSRII